MIRGTKEVLGRDLLFCVEYVKDGKAARAYVAAGFAERSASSSSSIKLSKPEIQAKIAELRKENQARISTEILWDKTDSARELKEMVMFDATKFFQDLEDGQVKSADEIPPEIRRCIQSIQWGVNVDRGQRGEETIVTKYIKSVKFYSRLDALDQLNKHIGFYEVDNSQKGGAVKDLIDELNRRSSGATLPVKP
jgi:phage terminase small subunit